MELLPVLELIAAADPDRGFVLVGVGGHGGAGKTTLARAIPDAQVVSTDEFWQGDGFDLRRLEREVIGPLLEGTGARYASYDWSAKAPRGERTISPTGVIVVEGVCALHRMFRTAYDVRVWVDAPRALRLERGVDRDGESARATWETRWIPAEERYVREDDPIPSAHLVVDGSGPPPA
jgi:uridine kinase